MPIHIPTIEQVSGQTRGFQQAGPQLVQPNNDIAQATQFAAREGEQLGHAIERTILQADAMKEAEGLTRLQRLADAQLRGQTAKDGTRAPGYLETQGEAALSGAAETLDTIKKQRASIADEMNDRQRRSFMARSDEVLRSFDNTVEQHSSRQFQLAKKATAMGFQQETLKAIENDPRDLTLPIRMAQVERTTRELQLSPEDGDADMSRFKAAAGMAQINGLLLLGDVAGAEKALEDNHDNLAMLRDEAAFKVAQKRAALDRTQAKIDNESIVGELMLGAKRPDQTIDRTAAYKALADVSIEKRGAARRLLETELNQYDKALEADKKYNRNKALNDFRRGGHHVGAINENTREYLEHYDNDYIKKLEDEETRLSRRAAKPNGARVQRGVDALVVTQFKTALIRDPDTDIGDFASGKTVSDKAYADMALLQERAKSSAGRKYESQKSQFFKEAESLVPEFKRQKGQKTSKYTADEKDEWLGVALGKFDGFIEQHGKPPDAKAVSEIVKEMQEFKPDEASGFEVFGQRFGQKKVEAWRMPQPGVAPTQPQQQQQPKNDFVEVVRRKDGKSKRMSRADAAKLDATVYEVR